MLPKKLKRLNNNSEERGGARSSELLFSLFSFFGSTQCSTKKVAGNEFCGRKADSKLQKIFKISTCVCIISTS